MRKIIKYSRSICTGGRGVTRRLGRRNGISTSFFHWGIFPSDIFYRTRCTTWLCVSNIFLNNLPLVCNVHHLNLLKTSDRTFESYFWTRVWHSWKFWHKWISEYIHFNSPIVNRSPDLSPSCIRVFFLLSHFVYNWQSWVLCPFPHLPPHFLARRHHIMEILCNCNFEQGLRFSGGNWRKNFSENNLDICEGIIFYQHRKRHFGLFFSIYLKKIE